MFTGKVSVVFFLSCISFVWSIDCELDVEVEQKLQGDGFHRDLTYSIKFLKEAEELSSGGCFISLEQPVPAGLYANPDELKELYRAKKLIAKVHDRVDVELTAEQSRPSTVYIVASVEERLAPSVPLHARYHKAVQGGGYEIVEIPPPKLFILCQNNLITHCALSPPGAKSGHCLPGAECSWKAIQYNMGSVTPTWSVPVGDLDHWQLTAFGTALAYLVCSVYVLSVLLGHLPRSKPQDTGKKRR